MASEKAMRGNLNLGCVCWTGRGGGERRRRARERERDRKKESNVKVRLRVPRGEVRLRVGRIINELRHVNQLRAELFC